MPNTNRDEKRCAILPANDRMELALFAEFLQGLNEVGTNRCEASTGQIKKGVSTLAR